MKLEDAGKAVLDLDTDLILRLPSCILL